MEDPTVNPVVTDAVTQCNVKVVGEAPAVAIGSLYEAPADDTAPEPSSFPDF